MEPTLQAQLHWLNKFNVAYTVALNDYQNDAWKRMINPVAGDFVCEYVMSSVYKTPIVGELVSYDRETATYDIKTLDGGVTRWESAWFVKVPDNLKDEILTLLKPKEGGENA